MIDPLLLTREDFDAYRDISENVDFDRLSVWILEAQKQELRNFLGPVLYLELITDWDEVNSVFLDQRFIDLWDGLDVPDKYRYYGLKPAIVYFAYARFLKNQNIVVTRYGVKNLERDESQDNVPSSTRTKQGEAQQMALTLQTDAETFINDNPADYANFPFNFPDANNKNIYHNVRRGNGGRWGVF